MQAQAKAAEPSTVDTRQNNATVQPVETPTLPSQSKDSAQVSAIHLPPENRGNIKVDVGDLVSVKVYGVAEMNDEIRVNGSGDISLPLIGSVHVEGLTSEQIERMMEKKLVDGGFLREPHVTVFVKEFVTQGVSVMGEVTRPGIYPMIGARHLYDVISIAGGPTAKTGDKVTITHRDHPETPVVVNLGPNFLSNMSKQDANVEIFPGDIVVFDKAGIVYVDVWDGFVDEDGRFAQSGPDFEGQTRRLRAGDGVHFTQAGARKLAHFVER